MEISDNDSSDEDLKTQKPAAPTVTASSKAKEKKIKEAEEGEKKPKKIHLRKDKGYGDHLQASEDTSDAPPVTVIVQGPKKV